ncbi:MAG TPA: DUF885 domain-containing protein [Cyclobacteriaceae bacterium]
MKNLLLLVAACSLLLFSCTPEKKQEKKETPSLDSLLTAYHEERLKLFPLDATSAGDNRYNDLLPNTLTLDYRKQVGEFFQRYKNLIASIDKNTLSAEERMSYDVLTWECNINLEGLQFNDHLLPINQMFATHLMVGQLASGSSIQPFKTVKDYDNWLSRLEAYVQWCDTAVVNMKKGIAQKYVLPKALTKKVIGQLANFDHGPVKEHLYYEPIKNIPADFSAGDKARLTKAYEEIIGDKIIPAHKKMKDFMSSEYLPASRESSGIDAVPAGKEYYAYLIKQFTTTSMTADQIFELGKQEVDRITKEMETVKNEVGYKGDMKSFFAYLRTKKELTPFTKPEQVIDNFNAIHERMKPQLSKLFDKTPKTSFVVRRTEAFREKTSAAEYVAGSQDATRPGIFYVPIPDVKTYNTISDEDLFLHEAIPGHHYQVMLQMENTSLPKFRQLVGYSAYAEGWGLYAESLGKELGLYTDPYQYFGMLSGEIHRAIRLVVDAGMHSQGWTREQAIQYSLDHEPRDEAGITSEVERYMAIPGQALSYKIGQLKIIELRAKAEKELGAKFNIAQFHNQVLDSGCIPLNVLEEKINRWIEEVKKAA